MRHTSRFLRVATLAVLAASVACAPRTDGDAATVEPRVPLLEGLGEHHYAISTDVPLAQQYFDQGLRLTYAFNHAEAVRAFEEAARLDPACAMCFWGKALALGPNINAPMDSASGAAAYEAIQSARAASNATERERALIEALASRYAQVPPAARASLDSAWARAMADVVRRYPDDLEAATLYAESLMDLTPWAYWNADGTPRPGTNELIGSLERVMQRNAAHPGACHFYIHAVEATYPERALPCAERLAALMPAAGHLVHMPGHIYIRVGRYADAIQANIHAVHSDETYISDQRPTGIYPAMYYPHNYHFLAFAALLAGRSEQALDAAAKVVEKTPVDLARAVPELQPMLPYLHLVRATFGRWEDVISAPVPPADLVVSYGLAQYARGLAFAATSRMPDAVTALDSVKAAVAKTTAQPAKTVLTIAQHALAGDIARARGDLPAAITAMRAAVALEDGLTYMEPPYWHMPVRHMLGAALLEAGRAAEAESVYREDLKRFPENGWSLNGLAKALSAQGRRADAAEADQRYAKAWGEPGRGPAVSRF